MLLAVQAARSYASVLPASSEEILLAVWERRNADEGLPSTGGKRIASRENRRDLSGSGIRIEFLPRPHITVELHELPLLALLDTGSELSFVNQETADHAAAQGHQLVATASKVNLADGAPSVISQTIRLPITCGKKTHWHRFLVMPSLRTAMLIGVDLWSKLEIRLAPPGRVQEDTRDASSVTRPKGLSPLTPDEEERLQDFLRRELEKFQFVHGPTNLVQHRIRLKTTEPIKQRYRPRNPAMQAIIDQEIDKMREEGIIEPSRSAWSSPVVVVRKKNGEHRFCIDFRRVNDVTERDAYPLPHIPATLDKLRGAKYLSTIDLKSGYWQVPLSPDSRPITAFTVPGRGLMQFRVMPFGLHSAPATFQRLLDTVLGPELEPKVLVYLDDIIVVSSSFEEHLKLLAEVFRRLRHAKLRPNPEKCHFCRNELRYLGHVINRQGIHTDPEKVEAITAWPTPTTLRKVRQFLGVASWYRRFIPDFSAMAAPLTSLTKKKARWRWTEDEETAFRRLKEALTTAPVLACPDFSRRFVLQTDASVHGLGAVLTQNFEEGERVIAFASRTLNGAERNYSATELECLAVVWGIRKLRNYLEGYQFTVVTDHQSLKWLQRLEEPTGRLARWLFELQQYDFDLRYRKGQLNKVADALSRQGEVCQVQATQQCRWYNRMLQEVQTRPADHPDYQIKNGQLFRHLLHNLDFRELDSREQWKLCVPKEDRSEVMRRFHDEATAGHLGVAKTTARIAQLYFWPGMFQDIARYVRSCVQCLAYKVPPTKPAGQLNTEPVKAPWEQVTIDLIGPLPRSNQGHLWLFVMQDRFTKWVELRPLRKATGPAVTAAIRDDIIYRHGCPSEIISDNGTQLRSKNLSELLQSHGVRHRFTPARAPQCNPVERTNRTVKTMVAQFIKKNQRRWDEQITALQFAFNTALHEATGFSPAYLNHGRELSRPHLVDRRGGGATVQPHRARQRLEDAFELVRIHFARAHQKQARHYNLRRRNWQPKIGEQVWKKEYSLSKKADAFNAKLAPRYTGPFTVKRFTSPVIVDLRDARGKWHRHVHIQDLKSVPQHVDDSEEGDADVVAACTSQTSQSKTSPNRKQPAGYIKASEQPKISEARSMSADDILASRYAEMSEETLDGLLSSVDFLVREALPPPSPPTRALSRREELEKFFGDPDLDESLDTDDEPDPEEEKRQAALRTLGLIRRSSTFGSVPAPRRLDAFRIPPVSWIPANYHITRDKDNKIIAVRPPQTAAETATAAVAASEPPTAEPATTMPKAKGSTPIEVEIAPGRVVRVPHHAVHKTRKYKIRLADGNWTLRFDHRGQLRTCVRH